MKTLLASVLFALSFFVLQQSYANSADSLSYEAQRSKVNRLLEERSQKFSDYDLSLSRKSGVFGLFKTKNDMQSSIDILKEVVITDNNIFIETKKLLSLKDFEKEKFEKLASEYDMQITGYMATINKLQDQNEKLSTAARNSEKEGNSSHLMTYLMGITILILAYSLYKAKKVTKP